MRRLPLLLIISFLCWFVVPVQAATFTVNSTIDAVDANIGDGVCETTADNNVCTLRAAIQETNALAGTDTIDVPAGTYTLTIAGIGENQSATGDLDTTDDLTVIGAGKANTIIDGGQIDRVFEIFGQFPGKTVNIIGVTIQNGNAVRGGAVSQYTNAGFLTLSNSIISGYTATQQGGGIFNITGTVILNNTIVSDNSGGSSGGGISSASGSLSLNDSTIANNNAGEGGGITAWGDLTITNSTISGNMANVGGGINSNGTLRLTNSTISDNTATAGQGGGGIISVGQAEITNATITANNSSIGSGIHHIGSRTIMISNTILANNSADKNCAGGSIISLGHNIDSGASCLFSGASDFANTDPLLGPLADNGGPTLTHSLLPGSPATDRGDDHGCPAADQRGFARPVDGDNDGTAVCDIGAYESVFAEISVIKIKLGEFLSQQLEAVPGVPPFTWIVSAGILPPGMDLSTDGVLSGTPTEIGDFTFTVIITDGNGEVTEKTFTVEVVLVLPPDIRISKTGTVPVPGRALDYFIVVENVGNTNAIDLEVTELVDLSQFSIVSATPNAEIISLDEPDSPFSIIVWVIQKLGPGEVTILFYQADLKSTIPLGTEVVGGPACHETDFEKLKFCLVGAVLTSLGCTACQGICGLGIPAGCLNPIPPVTFPVAILNCISCMSACGIGVAVVQRCYFEASGNCSSDENPARGPVDPNEKLVIANKFIQPDQLLVYPIHFENIGDVEALDVFVTDVLEPNLDESTLEIITPDGALFNLSTRTLKWDLFGRSLQPGETDNGLFFVRPKPGLASGTEIHNSAEIQFEIFDPLVTPEVVNIIDTTLPSCAVEQLPAETSTLDFDISWSGTDEIGEIDTYSIFVSVDDGTFKPFIERTRDTSTNFVGDSGKTYGLICIATDTAGNSEFQELISETSTLVNPPCEGDFNNDKDIDGGDLTDYIENSMGITLEEFALDFGRNICP